MSGFYFSVWLKITKYFFAKNLTKKYVYNFRNPTPKIAKISKSYRKRSGSVSFVSIVEESKKSILASKGRSLTMVGEKMKATKVTQNNFRK